MSIFNLFTVLLAKGISIIANIIAITSTFASIFGFFEEPKIPESLLKK